MLPHPSLPIMVFLPILTPLLLVCFSGHRLQASLASVALGSLIPHSRLLPSCAHPDDLLTSHRLAQDARLTPSPQILRKARKFRDRTLPILTGQNPFTTRLVIYGLAPPLR
ncbi:hypothetical protein F5Y18DRAFT_397114 [Xylariaceae sp. FL1019]|nr:hypothetical protein F5Y18DRAFT_397114 [Xylariaceae sp. FL1019]